MLDSGIDSGNRLDVVWYKTTPEMELEIIESRISPPFKPLRLKPEMNNIMAGLLTAGLASTERNKLNPELSELQ